MSSLFHNQIVKKRTNFQLGAWEWTTVQILYREKESLTFQECENNRIISTISNIILIKNNSAFVEKSL